MNGSTMSARAHAGDPEAVQRVRRARLKRSDSLDLSGLGLRSVPREIGELEGLVTLDVTDNLIDHLPTEIAQLPQIESLELDNNQLRTMPPLDRMVKLSRISLVGNGMSKVPSAVWTVRSLKELYLGRNNLTMLPLELGQLTRLQTLDVSANQIHALPREMSKLKMLRRLDLDHNPLDDPLPALLSSGIADLFAYLRSLGDAEPQYEAKLLLVGEGEVGKSSLITALENGDFLEGRSSTHGIEVRPLRLDHPSRDVQMLLNAWDFGGQELYRITHQFFFTERAIYLVVWKPRQGQQENAIEDWIRRIVLRVGGEAKVLVVSTHAGQRAAELDYPVLKARFGDVLVGSHAVDNEDRLGIEDLRADIALHAAELPQMGEIVSAAWQAARRKLLALPEAHISYERFGTICRDYGLDDDATRALARMLHHLGLVIYYDEDDGLRDIVVLQPEWLTKAISYVLEDKPTRAACGVLDHRRLREIWDTEALGGYEPRDHPYFLRLMEKFDVSYRMPQTQQSLVGQLVPYERPEIAWGHRERTLSLRCQLAEPVDGLIGWLTVRHHRHSVGVHWRRGVFLVHDRWGSQALLELADAKLLTLTVSGPSPSAFFDILRDGIQHLIDERWEGLSYELLVPCRGRLKDGSPCPESFKLRHLERDREDGELTKRCSECRHSLDIGELLTGFAPAASPLHAKLDAIEGRLSDMAGDMAETKARTSEVATEVRRLLRAVNEEVPDCPRLFTLVPMTAKGAKALRLWGLRSRLTLWCEHADHEHPWNDASYELQQNKAWVNQVAPYAALVVKALQVILPVATAGLKVGMSEHELKSIKDELDLMKAIVAELPTTTEHGYGAHYRDPVGLTRAEGSGLRALRSLLTEKDYASTFGGLRRRQTPAGDFVWICPDHIHEYDPGLPVLPHP